MAFEVINSTEIEVGDPIKAELFTKIKNSLDDLDQRVTDISIGAVVISLMNHDVRIGSTGANYLTGAMYIEALQACNITEVAIQLFSKAPATTGNLTVDIKKNTSTNPTGFSSVLSILPTFNIATASDFQRTTGTINPAAQALNQGDILRLDITSLPTGLQSFRIVVKGEL